MRKDSLHRTDILKLIESHRFSEALISTINARLFFKLFISRADRSRALNPNLMSYPGAQDGLVKSRANTPISTNGGIAMQDIDAADISGFFDDSEEAYPMCLRG